MATDGPRGMLSRVSCPRVARLKQIETGVSSRKAPWEARGCCPLPTVCTHPCPFGRPTVEGPRPLPDTEAHSSRALQARPQCSAVLGASLCPGPGPQVQVAEQDPPGAQLLRHGLLGRQGLPRASHRGQVSWGSVRRAAPCAAPPRGPCSMGLQVCQRRWVGQARGPGRV